jgi:hypothetical protein
MSSRCLLATAGVINATTAVPKALKPAAHESQRSISVAEKSRLRRRSRLKTDKRRGWDKIDGGFFPTVRVANNTDDSKMRGRQRLYKKLTDSGLLRLMFVLLVVNETKITSTLVR